MFPRGVGKSGPAEHFDNPLGGVTREWFERFP